MFPKPVHVEKQPKPLQRSRIKSHRRKPKPYERGEAIHVFPDGREQCLNNAAGDAEYTNRTEQMWARQKRLCAICGKIMYAPTFDHQDGRGMNGSRRDDRIAKDGMPYNAAVHGECNALKGSKRTPYLFQVESL